ncbi:MAG TPA: hypothetical protein VEK76_10065 [Candidatus Binatia bacterium]|nr:hypothetical protein [Candidatus Binatia bacterium]
MTGHGAGAAFKSGAASGLEWDEVYAMAIPAEGGEIEVDVKSDGRMEHPPGGRRPRAVTAVESGSPVVRAGERLVHRIETLVDEIARLRTDNEELRQQVRDAVAMIDRAANAVGEPRPQRRARPVPGPAPSPVRRRRPRAHGARGRATPPEVTAQVVEAAIAKLGQGTASEIAAEITRAGVKVSGRAIRFLAERAGAETFRGEDGQRRYRLPGR